MNWEPCVPSGRSDERPACDTDEGSVRLYGWVVADAPVADIRRAKVEVGFEQAFGAPLTEWWDFVPGGCREGLPTLVFPRLTACPSLWSRRPYSELQYARYSADALIMTVDILANQGDAGSVPAGEARLLFTLEIPFSLTTTVPDASTPDLSCSSMVRSTPIPTENGSCRIGRGEAGWGGKAGTSASAC
jgi:hypothetical protein